MALAGAVCLASCSSDEEVNVSNDGRVHFTAGIGKQAVAAAPATRASGSAWASGDAIGIFMGRAWDGGGRGREQEIQLPWGQ